MAKAAVQFACTECGYSAGRWFGKCPGCSAFGTLVEEVVGKVVGGKAPPKPLLRLIDVEVEDAILLGVLEIERRIFLRPGPLDRRVVLRRGTHRSSNKPLVAGAGRSHPLPARLLSSSAMSAEVIEP